MKFPEQPDANLLRTLNTLPYHYDPNTQIWTAVDSLAARDIRDKATDAYGSGIAFACTADQWPELLAHLTTEEP